MRLRSLLGMTDIGLELVTGEDELDRFVRWVVTTDMLDPSRYLSGGELVLTGMQWRRADGDSETFVAALARAKVAALAAGDALYGEPPADIVEACRKHRIPLFRVPEQIAFATVTEQVNRHLSTGRAADLAAILDRHRKLVSGGGLDSVLELIDRELGTRCWVVSSTGRIVAGPSELPPNGLRTAFLAARRLPHVVTLEGARYSLFAVDPDGTSRVADWFLVFESDHKDWSEERRLITGELAAVVSLERARLDDRQSAEGRLAQELIELIVSDAKPADIIARLELTGLGLSERYLAVAATADAGAVRPRELRALLREILYGASPAAGVVDGEAIALVPLGDDPHIDDRIHRAIEALTPGLQGSRLSVGISGGVDGEGLRGAVEEARYARRMAAERNQPTSVVRHDELATHMLLLASVPDEVRRMFRVRLLDPLINYDKDNRSDLVHTLETFLEVSGSWTKCAEMLHLHVNTLRYRIQRIEELTERDLSRLEDRVDFFLALALR
ncbi:PucR family transcriptional regulator [Nocardia huaxiensis]|uniref:PucR family transcriptional regulator ligand-binding domain-containing protein n=1 Tax=Nocardia huaxiensis TaxID=2755382 RepID=A0A7D6V9I5_9NOCA|nr:PucR family transcriptional regulator [Nocardia huaxiensis]QLY28922.1 PucR family transcriptional regulator ligand-binding domain-containing protein [Nocardia huaxiensis]UFS97603.1 PucR family transcriptional regulator ligand-binding domain-containing protein [Nocardia huaxiensis]